ncbi:hypothetical protein ABPG74_000906 [Tetrahymena malaccensis]
MNQNVEQNPDILSKFPWFYHKEWDYQTFRICIELLGIKDNNINQIQINQKGVSNILEQLNQLNVLNTLIQNPLFAPFKNLIQRLDQGPCQHILQSQAQLKEQTNLTFYKTWNQQNLCQFVKLSQINISFQQHKDIISNRPTQGDTIDCKIYKQWIKYTELINLQTVSQSKETTHDSFEESKNQENDLFIREYQSNQQYSLQTLISAEAIEAVCAILSNITIYVVKQDSFNVNQELLNRFRLNTNEGIQDFNLFKLKTLKLKNQNGQEYSFLHLQFNTLQKQLYYQIFTEKLAVGDEIFIQQSQITLIVKHLQYSKESETMSYTLLFYFETNHSIIYCEVTQQNGEIKTLGRYQYGNNSQDIYNFNEIYDFDLQHFSRDYAFLEVKNENLYIRWNKKKLWKNIKENNLILLQPFINIRLSSMKTITIFQGLSNNTQQQILNSCEHQRGPAGIQINKVSKHSSNIQTLNSCLSCQAWYYQINKDSPLQNIIEENQDIPIQQDQIQQYLPQQRYLFNVTEDIDITTIIDYLNNL